MSYHHIGPRELATVLAALRQYQAYMGVNSGQPPADLHAIATNDGEFLPLDISHIDSLCERLNRADGPNDEKYRDAASEKHGRDGECEIDGNGLVSVSSDGGAYVMAWVWVDDEEAGIGPEEDDNEP